VKRICKEKENQRETDREEQERGEGGEEGEREKGMRKR
jgi:hypothetical protein